MSDILEDTLQRLKDRSGAPVLEDPDALTDAVMMATEPRRPVSVWLTVLRICSSMAAVLLIGLFIGLREQPSAQALTSDRKTDRLYKYTVEQQRQSLSLAAKVVAFKNRAL